MKTRQTFRGVVLRQPPARPAAPRPAPGRSPLTAGEPPRVRVGREVAGRAGKGVSVIRGLPLGREALEELAARLKRLCGAGGAVRDGTIEIQGEHRDRLVAELIRLGYPAKRAGG
ncbi:MAG TPA: stress response translation initiation inhibitor YciH [Steroidobacteraceae bacterium]|jgi:translation initiation factor 1|nr:stress response translation initiation inhibitor YciH [Steroidobacteraceae bacterium]